MGLEERPRTGRPGSFSPGADRRGQGAGVRAAGRARASRSRAGQALSSPARRLRAGSCEQISGVTGVALAVGGRHPPVELPLLDLPARPPASGRRPAACSTSTRAAGRASCCIPATSWSAADEKPSIQARARKHPTPAAKPGGAGQLVEHEYDAQWARCATSPPGTCGAPRFSIAARPRTASSRSTR